MFKIVPGVEPIVAEELPERAMEIVGAGFDRGIENGGSRAAELRAEARGLNLEFFNRIDRGRTTKFVPFRKSTISELSSIPSSM